MRAFSTSILGLLVAASSVSFCVSSCGSTSEGPTAPARINDGRNEVIVLGAIHSRHLGSQRYGTDELKAIISRVNPDFILAEIPPERLPIALAEYRAQGTVQESRVSRFPEYVDAAFPLLATMNFEIIGCAAWTSTMASERRALLQEWKESRPGDTAKVDEAMKEAKEAIADGHAADDPRWIHSPGYDRLVKTGMTPYSELFGRDLGTGGWPGINAAHYALIEAAIEEHGDGGNKRFLVIFGSWHKYWFLEQLKERKDLRVLGLRDFL